MAPGEDGPDGSIVDQGTYQDLAKRHDLTTLVERINSATSSSALNSTAASAAEPASASAPVLDASVERDAATSAGASSSTSSGTSTSSPTNTNSTAGSIATKAALSMGDVPGTGLECNEANECIPKYKDGDDHEDDTVHHKHRHVGKVSGWRACFTQ